MAYLVAGRFRSTSSFFNRDASTQEWLSKVNLTCVIGDCSMNSRQIGNSNMLNMTVYMKETLWT